ncbi:hypothetical protein J6A31_04935 [bacterium]|nr:hypothetical protein [bacterium]
MAYICTKPANSCSTCNHLRPDEDGRPSCFAQVDETRQQNLADTMVEYLSNLKTFDLKSINVDENTGYEDTYNRCLNYIAGLKDKPSDRTFYENTLGFTKDELLREGMDWLYD